MNTSGVKQHANQVVVDMGKLFRGSTQTILVLLNLVAMVILSIIAVTQFYKLQKHDVIVLSDAAFADSPSFNQHLPLATTYVSDPKIIALNYSLCEDRDHICKLANVAPLTVSRSGLLSSTFLTLSDNSLHITHIIWVVSWFTTPISLFLFANANWFSFEQWMWWILYIFIFVWNSVGLILMLFAHATPMYNSVFAILYAIFSSMLIWSVREAWKVVTNDGTEKVQIFAKMNSNTKSQIPKLMQVSMTKLKPAYVLAASESQTAPIEIRYIFSQTALIVTELFFLIPIVYLVAMVMIQYRVTPFDLQTRYWLSTIFYGSLVLMEKARRAGVTYMTDVCLISFSIATTVALEYFFVADLVLLFSRHVPTSTVVIYMLIVASQIIGIGIIACNIYLAAIMQKNLTTMTEMQEDNKNINVTNLETVEKLIYKSILILLIVTKIVLGIYLSESKIKVA